MKYDFAVDLEATNNSHMGLINRVNLGERVLELGCATGYLSQILKQHLNCYVVGVDIDAQAAEKAEEFCDRVIVADLDVGDLSSKLNGETFDVIMCADVLEHLKQPESILSGLKALLSDQGRLLASVPNVAHASIRLELLRGHFDYEQLGLLDDTHLHFYTREGLVNMLMEAGFICHDIAYTVRDLADEAIQEHLSAVGLIANEQTFAALHEPDAVAYQFIVEARAVYTGVSTLRIPPLQPKPFASSDVYYRQREDKIVKLEHKLDQVQVRLELQKQHSSAVEMQKQVQEAEHQTALNSLIIEKHDSERLINHQQLQIDEISEHYERLKHEYGLVAADRSNLEKVLQRVHGKLSYRTLQVVRKTVRGLQGWFLPVKRNRKEAHEADAGHDYTRWVEQYDQRHEKELSVIRKAIKKRASWPKIAILMPVYNTQAQQLERAIESVLYQLYPNWQLCIADNGSNQGHVRELIQHYAQHNAQIKTVYLPSNSPVADASNSALEMVDAEYVMLMGANDLLAQDALYRFAQLLVDNSDVELIYSDEDKLDTESRRIDPWFKPDWNPDLFLAQNFICHLGCYHTERVRKLGGFRAAYEGALEYDLALRYVEGIEPTAIAHIPRILYHRRSLSGNADYAVHEKHSIEPAIKAVVEDALQRRSIAAEVVLHDSLPKALRIRYRLPENPPLVSIIIPTRNGYTLLKRCVDSILQKTDYPSYEILIVDNGSDEPVVLHYLQQIQEEQRVTVLRDDRPFNFSALNNSAVKQANGEVIALVNNDLEVISNDWLTEMVSLALREETGAVGAKLYYSDDTLQHGGVIVGIGGVAGHAHKHYPRNASGYCGRLLLTQNLSAVTAACLVLRKSVFESVGGFNEEHLSVAFNDVDLCLKIRAQGYFNVWTPYAEMYHHESATRGFDDTPDKQVRFSKEIAYIKKSWAGHWLENDSAYNPNLTLDREDYSLAWPPRLKK